MEIQIPYTILFTFFCSLLLIHKLSSNSKKSKSLPPGPPQLPIIGNLHQLLAGLLPHRALRDLANKYGPFMHLKLGQISYIIVSSPEYAKEVLKTHDQISANRFRTLAADTFFYNSSDIVFSSYGNYWRQLRKICTLELLSAKRVQTFRAIREEEILAFMKSISKHEGSVMNLSRKIFQLTNSIVARSAFGKKTKNVEEILPIIEHVVRLTNGLSVSDFYPSLKFLSVITGMKGQIVKLHKEVDKMLGNIISDHKENKGRHIGEAEEDLVDVLLRIQKEDDLGIPLSNDNVKAVVLDIFGGGTDTAATTTEWAMSELLRNPEAMKKAQAEVRRVYGDKGYVNESEVHQLKYVAAVIKETLRIHPPGLIPRETSETCEINGYEIPRKTRVIVNAWAIGRDPKNWNEPEKFKPERFLDTLVDYNFKGANFEYIPFGAGRRICPGISFATAVVELLLSNLLYHFDWKLPKGMKPDELEINESFGAIVRRKNDLCVVPIGYCP